MLQQPEPMALKSRSLTVWPAGYLRRQTSGFTVAALSFSQTPRHPVPLAHKIRQTRSAFFRNPPGGASLHRSLTSSPLNPPAQTPSPHHSAHQSRFLASVPGSSGPSEATRPRPPAPFQRPPRYRRSKISLGYISTPLRKRPNRGRHQATTKAPPRVEIHITKPAVPLADLKSTARLKFTPTTGFKDTDGLKDSTPATIHLNISSVTSQPKTFHQSTSKTEVSTTTQDLKFLPESHTSSSPQGSPLQQNKSEALAAAGLAPLSSSSSLFLSSLSALGIRKNKPVASSWSLLNMSGGEIQTSAAGNLTDQEIPDNEYSSGSGPFMYDMTELVGERSPYRLYQFDALSKEPNTGPDARNSDPQSASHLFIQPSTPSERGSEHFFTQTHFHNGSESLLSILAAGIKPFKDHSPDLLVPETSISTLNQTLTTAQTHHELPKSSGPSGQKQEESSYAQLERLSLQAMPSSLPPSSSSHLFMQPTPSLPMAHLSSPSFLAEVVFPKQIFSSFVPQKEDKAQISSLSLNPLGSKAGLAVASSSLVNNLYTDAHAHIQSSVHVIPHRSSILSPPSPPFHEPFQSLHYSSSSILPPTSPFSLFQLEFTATSAHASPIQTIIPQYSPLSPTLPLASDPLWPTLVPFPPSAAPRYPSLLLPSSSQPAERRLSETAHMPVSVLSFLSSNLQKNFEDSTVDTASLLSFPLFSKAPAESQSPFVDSALHPEYHSAEKSSSGLSKANRNEVPSTVHNLSPDTRSHTLTHAEDFSDNSFSHTNPTPSRLSVEALVSSPAALVPDFGPALSQLEFPVSELNLSVVLWPSSDAASLSVRPFLVHSHQKDLSEIETRSVLHTDTGLTSLPTAGIWGHDHTLALLRANIEGKQEPPSSSASSTSSSNVFLLTQSSHIPSFTDSIRETEGMMGEETVLTQKSLSGSQERDSSSPTVNRDPWRLHHAVSHLHNQGEVNGAAGTRTNSQAPAGYDSGFSLSTPPLLNSSQMLAHRDSSSAQLGVTAPRHAPGMALAHVSGLTRANTVQPGRLIQTHISAHTQLPTHSNSQAHTQNFRSDGLNLSEGANTRGPRQQSPILSFFTPLLPVLLPSMSSSVSLVESVSLLLPSQHLSYTYPPVSPSVSTLSSSFLLPSRATWPAAPASMMNTEIGSLSPTRPTVRFLQPTAAQSLQRPTIQPVEEFISNTQSLSFGQVSMESIQSRLLISPNQDEVLSQFTNHSQPQNESTLVGVLISEASNKQTAGGRLSHLSAPFNPADVVPKIHFANEHVSPVSNKAPVILSAVTGHHPNEHVTPQSALNSLSSPVDMQNTPCPISESCYQPGSATSSQPNVALVLPTPLQSSDLNTPSSTSRSPTGFSIEITNHGFISGLDELSPPGRDNHTTNTAGFKYIPESNSTTAVALRDSPVAPAAMTNITAAKDASALVEKGSLDVSEGSMTGSRPVPVLVNAAAAAKSNLTASEPGLNSSPNVSNHSRNQSSGGLMKGDVNQDHGTGKIKDNNLNFSPTPPAAASGWHLITPKISSPTPPFRALSPSANAGSSSGLKKATLHPSLGSPTANPSIRPTLPCRCKQRFLFTCQCGLPSGNSMLCSNNFVVIENKNK